MGHLVARLAPGTTGAICAQMAGSSHTCRLALGASLIFAAFFRWRAFRKAIHRFLRLAGALFAETGAPAYFLGTPRTSHHDVGVCDEIHHKKFAAKVAAGS